MPEVAGKQSPGHGVARSRQQPLPLYVHSMLLVPLCAGSAAQRKIMTRQSTLNKQAVTGRHKMIRTSMNVLIHVWNVQIIRIDKQSQADKVY